MARKNFQFKSGDVYLYEIKERRDIEESIKDILHSHANNLPGRENKIFIKPNFNNDLLGLTGNSTDLRILYFLVLELQSLGYSNITVGDGPNVGIFRRKINWIRRLRLDRLSKILGVEIIDINHDAGIEYDFGQDRVKISRTLLNSAFRINLSKVKTHVATRLSGALKNSVGTAIGDSKRLVHQNLVRNIVRLNEIVKWNLVISDGIVAMEGNGPGDGTPLYSNILLASNNPFLMDVAISKIFGFKLNKISTLAIALSNGLIVNDDYNKEISPIIKIKEADEPRILSKLSDSRLFFIIKAIIRPFLKSYTVTNFFYTIGATQDQYSLIDDAIEKIIIDKELCKRCKKCELFCPLGFTIDNIDHDICLRCAYCYFVCPNNAKVIIGKKGFLEHHIKRYKNLLSQEILK